jgi:hypothetical protein
MEVNKVILRISRPRHFVIPLKRKYSSVEPAPFFWSKIARAKPINSNLSILERIG